MRKKKNTGNQVSVVSETYVPATLPKHGQNLDGFITSDYSVNDLQTRQSYYEVCEKTLAGVLATGDKFTPGRICDQYVDGQVEHLYVTQQQEEAMRTLQAHHITSEREVRTEELLRKKSRMEERIAELTEKIQPLKDLCPQFEISIGRFHIPAGLPITLSAMAVDILLNISFLQGVLLQNAMLLLITVLCMSVMSDGTMYCLGLLVSRKDEKFMPIWLLRLLEVSLVALFLLSVVSGVMIRFGSMDVTFGTINAAGQFVGKTAYSAAEWGVSLVTAFLTTCTGLISLAFSIDHNAHLVSRRRGWEAEKAVCEKEYEAVCIELSALTKAADPIVLDNARRAAGRREIEALRDGMKLHMRALQAQLQGDAAYTEAMADSAEALMQEKESRQKPEPLPLLPTPEICRPAV